MLGQNKLAKTNTEIATYMITKMKERENVLFESDTFNAILLERRVNSILTPDQRIVSFFSKENYIKLFFDTLNYNTKMQKMKVLKLEQS